MGYNRTDVHVQDCVVLTQMSHTCDSMKQGSNNVNTSKHECMDVTHTNLFALLCVDSFEDEGDSLDFDTVKYPDVSCTVKGF